MYDKIYNLEKSIAGEGGCYAAIVIERRRRTIDLKRVFMQINQQGRN